MDFLSICKRTLCVLALSFSLTSIANADDRYRVLVVGDQLSRAGNVEAHQRWVSGVKKLLSEHQGGREIKLINASNNNENTHKLRAKIRHMLKVHRPDLVILQVGPMDSFSRYTVEYSSENLGIILSRIQQAGAKSLLVDIKLPETLSTKSSYQRHAAFQKIAKRKSAALAKVDLATPFTNLDLSYRDFGYLISRSQEHILSAVWPKVQSIAPAQNAVASAAEAKPDEQLRLASAD